MAESFATLTGPAAPYLEENVATNVISVQRPHSAGPYKDPGDELFFGLRFDEDGREIPDFVLNRPRYRDAKFLIAGANFGCASSREAAVTALSAFGIRCVIAPSVGDIFFNNCFKFGVLPVLLPEADVLALAEEASSGGKSGDFIADLNENSLTAPSGQTFEISLPEFRRTQLLEGLDEIALTMRSADDIAAFHRAAADERPYLYGLERP
jgi:3-isopropylmalate/(R)-2-methylmalate dehydratase small subunit